MYTIDQIHDIIRTKILKDQQGYLTPEEIDNALDFESVSYFASLYGTTQTYQPGRPVSVVATGQTQRVHDDLLPFLETIIYNNEGYHPTTNPFGTAGNGKVVLPDDFLHFSSLAIATPGSYSTLTDLEFLDSLPGADQIANIATEPYRIYKLTLTNPDGNIYSGETKIVYNDLEGGDDITIHSGGTVNATGVYYFVPTDYNGRITVSPTTTLNLNISVQSETTDWDDVELLGDDQWWC